MTCRFPAWLLLSPLLVAGCAGPALREPSTGPAGSEVSVAPPPADAVPTPVQAEAALVRQAALESGFSDAEAAGIERSILQAKPEDRELLTRCIYGHLNHRRRQQTDRPPATEETTRQNPASTEPITLLRDTPRSAQTAVTEPERDASQAKPAGNAAPPRTDERVPAPASSTIPADSPAAESPAAQSPAAHNPAEPGPAAGPAGTNPTGEASSSPEPAGAGPSVVKSAPLPGPVRPTDDSQEVTGNRAAKLPLEPPEPLAIGDGSEDIGSWHRDLRMAAVRLSRELEQAEAMDPLDRSRLQTALSLMQLITEDSERAIESLEGLDDHEMEFWRQTLVALDILMDGDEIPKLRHRVENASEHLQNGLTALSNLGPLRLENLALVDEVKSYGAYHEIGARGFSPGEPVLVYVEVSNFAVEETPTVAHAGLPRRSPEEAIPMYECDLLGRCDILDANQRVVMSKTLGVTRDKWRKKRRDFYIAYDFTFPQLAAGDYTFELTIEDRKGDKYGNAAIGFRIR